MLTALLILLSYAASVGLLTCVLRAVADPYGHFTNAKDWWDCFRVAVIWPWHMARIACLLAWAWWEERDYD